MHAVVGAGLETLGKPAVLVGEQDDVRASYLIVRTNKAAELRPVAARKIPVEEHNARRLGRKNQIERGLRVPGLDNVEVRIRQTGH